jgi:hypothetical protein
MELQIKNNHALRQLVVLLVLLLPSIGRADWTCSAGSVKLYVKKQVSLPAIGQKPKNIPPGVLAKWSATIIDEHDTYLIVQVPSSNASGLRSDLLSKVESAQIRNDLDILDFLSSPLDARLPEPSYPAPWDRSVPLPAPARDAFVVSVCSRATSGVACRSEVNGSDYHRLHSAEWLHCAGRRGCSDRLCTANAGAARSPAQAISQD